MAPMVDGKPNLEMLPYACGGVVFAGLVYLLMSGLISVFGVRRIMRFFPPVVTGPIIIAIGLIRSPALSATAPPTGCWPLWRLSRGGRVSNT